jgi:hypothetical protein
MATALTVAAIASACAGSTELAPPEPEEGRLIRSAVRAYVTREARDGNVTLWDVQRGATRPVRVQEVGEPETVRSRYYLVPANAVSADGERLEVAFFVVAAGPVYVVDTAVIAPKRAVRFGP